MIGIRRGLLRGVVAGLFLLIVLTAQDTSAQGPQSVLQTFKGHTDPVYAVNFSTDGRYVVTASFDKSIKIWDATNGKEFRAYEGSKAHTNLVLALSMSPDGTEIASGSSDNTARTWDFPGQTPIRTVDLPVEGVGVTISTDGQKSAVALKDGTVKIINQADGKELFTLKGHVGPVRQIALAPNNQLLLTTGSDGTLRSWNPTNGQPVALVGAHTAPITGLTIRPDNSGMAFTSSEDGTVKLWTLPPVPSRALSAPHGGPVTGLVLSPDGNQLFTASADKTVRQSTTTNGQQVRVFGPLAEPAQSMALRTDVQQLAVGLPGGKVQLFTTGDGKEAGSLQAHTGGARALAFHPGNNALFSAGADGLLRTWTLPLVPMRALPHPDVVTASIATPDGKRVFSAANDKTIYGWNLAAPQTPERRFSGHPTPITALAVKNDGQLLVSAGEDGVLRFWNATNSQPGEVILGHAGAVTSLSMTADGSKVLSSGVDGAVRLWQVPTTAAIKPLAHPDVVLSATLSADGNGLVTGSNDKQVRLWNLQNFQPKAIAGLTQPPQAVALAANNSLVAGGSAEKAILVWSTGDAKEQARFVNTPAPVQSLAFHPDNKTLAAGFADGTITTYDVTLKKEVKPFKAHGGPVTGLAFLPNGDLLSGSADKTVQVWNPADGKNKAKIDTPAPLVGLSVSKDGKRLATSGQDRGVKVWDLEAKKELVSIAGAADIRGVGLSPDGQRVAVAGTDKLVRMYGSDGKLMESFPHDGAVGTVDFTPDGKRLVSTGADKAARVFTPSLLWQGHHGGPVRQAFINTKGDRVVSASEDKAVRLFNLADGKQLQSIPADGPVVDVASNADSTRLAIAAGNTVKWIDPSSGDKSLLATYTVPAPVTRVALSPNATRLAASFTAADGKSHPVSVWDVTPGKEAMADPLQVLSDSTGTIRGLTFLADNRTLLTAEADRNARLLDVPATGVLRVHDGAVTGLALNAAANQAITSGADRTIKHWDLAQGKVLRTFGPLPGAVAAMSTARDFTQVAAAAGKQTKVWNVADGKEVATLESPAEVKTLNYPSDKARLVSGDASGAARVWDLATGQEQLFYPHAGGPIEGVAFGPGNTTIIAAGAEKTASIHTLGLNRVVPVGSPVRSLTVNSNGAQVITGADDKSVKQWNTGSGAMERTYGAGESVARGLAMAKNNTFVAVAGSDKQLRLFNTADGKLIGAMPLLSEPVALALTANQTLAGVAGKDGTVSMYNVGFTAGQPLPPEFGSLQLTYRHVGEASDLTFTGDNNFLLSTGTDRKLNTWKVPSSGPTRNFPHPAIVDAVNFSPDGKVLATGCHDGKLRFFDLVKNTPLKEVVAHPAPANPPNQQPFPIYALTFTPDGKRVLTGSLEGNAKLWEVPSGNLVKEFRAYKEKEFEQGHRDGIFCVAVSPNGQVMATGSSDRTIKFWNPADGAVVRTLSNPNLKARGPMAPPPSHPGSVYGVRFIENGQKLLSVGGAPRGMGYIAIWNVADGALVYSEEVPLGTLFGLAVSPDGSKIAIGTGASMRTAGVEANNAYLMQTPKK